MKKTIIILLLFEWMASCGTDEGKQMQSIDFGEIAPQQLRNGSVTLQATASSGLPVFFISGNAETVAIEGDKAVFKQAGRVNIIASQPGNEQFYEAPEITRQLLVRDWDPNKKTQEITFDLPAEWKLSLDGQQLKLDAVTSSVLPVSYALSSTKYGFILNRGNAFYLYLYHAGEGGTPREAAYNVQLSITASQAGNEEYNPADNVERTIHVIGDVFH